MLNTKALIVVFHGATALKLAVIKSGADENATVHTNRHSFATHMMLDGVDIRTVQELLGHNSPETAVIYTHITDKMKKDVKSPLDNLDILTGSF